MLLGGNICPAILKEGVKNGICLSLVAAEIVVGWIVTGPVRHKESRRICLMTNMSINYLLTKFWDLEEVPKKQLMFEGDITCENLFESSTSPNSEGRLPLKTASIK